MNNLIRIPKNILSRLNVSFNKTVQRTFAFRRRSFVKKDDTQVKKEPKQVTEKKTKRSAKKEDEAIISPVKEVEKTSKRGKSANAKTKEVEKTPKVEEKAAKKTTDAAKTEKKPEKERKTKSADDKATTKAATKSAKTTTKSTTNEHDSDKLKGNLGRKPFDSEITTYHWVDFHSKWVYDDYIQMNSNENTKFYIMEERKYGANNYAPLPVVIAKGKGNHVVDVDNVRYYDCLSAYSALNLGHANKDIINASYEQMMKLHMTSRAFYNNLLYKAAKALGSFIEYEKVMFMNTGVEAGETAIKIARKWGYVKKGIPKNEAKVVFAKGNFWGRTITACATSDDPGRYENFGPYDNHFYLIEYDNLKALEECLSNDPNICAVMLEPIQGENGVVIPSYGYLRGVSDLCKKHNVLYIDDEIQTGLGRAGYYLYAESESVHPDIVLLGKSLSGGLYPVSAVATSTQIMDVIEPGDHGSTYGGNPLACNIVLASIQEYMKNDNAVLRNAQDRGSEFGLYLQSFLKNNKLVKEIRGRGLMFAIELHDDSPLNAYDLSLLLMERGVLTKPTKKHNIRLTPPLTSTSDDIFFCARVIATVLNKVAEKIPDYQNNQEIRFNFERPTQEGHLSYKKKTQELNLQKQQEEERALRKSKYHANESQTSTTTTSSTSTTQTDNSSTTMTPNFAEFVQSERTLNDEDNSNKPNDYYEKYFEDNPNIIEKLIKH